MSALSAYLAKNYLSASISNDPSDPNFRPKKRRKKDKTESQSLLIADDDESLLLSNSKGLENEDDGDIPTFDRTVRSAEFKKSKKSLWKSVDDSTNNSTRGTVSGEVQDEAEKILQHAAEESERQRQDLEDEDAPVVVESQVEERPNSPKMASGAKVGLQTAADIAKMIEKEKADEKKTKKTKSRKEIEPEPETIYRDATGRRIDVSMKRAEARAAEIEAQKKIQKDREDAMGDVQRRMKEERKQDLEDAQFLTIGRSADDEDMNQNLKEVVRWDDPMAAYMAQKEVGLSTKSREKGESQSVTAPSRKKVYQGHAPPNRYGILPGWRWDGVDRGTGFEKEWFQARGRKSRNENLEYQWQMDE